MQRARSCNLGLCQGQTGLSEGPPSNLTTMSLHPPSAAHRHHRYVEQARARAWQRRGRLRVEDLVSDAAYVEHVRAPSSLFVDDDNPSTVAAGKDKAGAEKKTTIDLGLLDPACHTISVGQPGLPTPAPCNTVSEPHATDSDSYAHHQGHPGNGSSTGTPWQSRQPQRARANVCSACKLASTAHTGQYQGHIGCGAGPQAAWPYTGGKGIAHVLGQASVPCWHLADYEMQCSQPSTSGCLCPYLRFHHNHVVKQFVAVMHGAGCATASGHA